MWNIEELKKRTVSRVVDGLINYLGVTESEAVKLVENAGIEEMVEIAPDLMLHYSKEQLVYDILR